MSVLGVGFGDFVQRLLSSRQSRALSTLPPQISSILHTTPYLRISG